MLSDIYDDIKGYFTIILPTVAVTLGTFYDMTWAGNLFTGWAWVVLLFMVLVYIGLHLPESIDGITEEYERDEIEPSSPVTYWLGKITSAYELLVCVAFGWWVTAVAFGFSWALVVLVRMRWQEIFDKREEAVREVMKQAGQQN